MGQTNVERIGSVERRVAGLEARSRFLQTLGARLRFLLRWLATTLPLLLVLLVGLEQLSSMTSLPLGVLLFLLWETAAILWAVAEVFAGGDMRFRLRRLILIVAIIAVILGYWQVAVHGPFVAEQNCLTSLKGLKGNVHRRPVGPAWLIGLAGKAPFERVVQIELAGPEADQQQIGRLRALARLSSLFLSGPEFDDDMLDDLAALPGLEDVWLTDSRVTAAGLQRFRDARPNVQITRQGNIIDDTQQVRMEIR
jgi:hypothetical protein